MSKEDKTFYKILSETIKETKEKEEAQKKPSDDSAHHQSEENINSIGRRTGMFDTVQKSSPDEDFDQHVKEMMKLYSSDIDDLDERELELYL